MTQVTHKLRRSEWAQRMKEKTPSFPFSMPSARHSLWSSTRRDKRVPDVNRSIFIRHLPVLRRTTSTVFARCSSSLLLLLLFFLAPYLNVGVLRVLIGMDLDSSVDGGAFPERNPLTSHRRQGFVDDVYLLAAVCLRC